MMKEIRSFINLKKEVPPNNSSHLKEGRPIRACIGTPEQFDPNGHLWRNSDTATDGIIDLNYRGGDIYDNKRFKYYDKYSYIISVANKDDKSSVGYQHCTGIVVVGYTKKTIENESIFSHQDPCYIFSNKNNKNTFTRNLILTLDEIKKRCTEGTIDAVIFGGNYFNKYTNVQENYINSIKLLTTSVEETLGFKSIVIAGPKTGIGTDDVYFKTDERLLYIVRKLRNQEVGNGNLST